MSRVQRQAWLFTVAAWLGAPAALLHMQNPMRKHKLQLMAKQVVEVHFCTELGQDYSPRPGVLVVACQLVS